MAAAHMSTHLESLGLNSANDVRRYWLHQANLSMNQLITKKLLGSKEFSADVAPIILDEFAKTIEQFGLGGEFQASTSEVTERHLDQPRPQQGHLVGIAP